MGIIYCLTFPNGKHYIGQTITSMKTRMRQHRNSPGCEALYNAIQKYKKYTQKILIETDNENLDYHEKKFIEEMNTMVPNGYNIRSGGSDGTFGEETRLKMRNSRLGKKHSEETKEKIRKALSGKPRTEETKRKLSEYFKGRKMKPKDTKDKSSEIKITVKLPQYMYKISGGKNYNSGYRICMPGYPNRYFTSKVYSDEEKFLLAQEYLNKTSKFSSENILEEIQKEIEELNISEFPIKNTIFKSKSKYGLPKYIHKISISNRWKTGGYRVSFPNKPSKLSDEQKFMLAKEHLNKLNNECSSTTKC